MTNEIVPQSQTELSTVVKLSDVFRQHAPNEWLLENMKQPSSRYSRLSLYVQWLNESGNHWTSPDLATYAEYLLNGNRVIEHAYKGTMRQNLSARSVKAHLSTIRGQFKKMMGASFRAKVKQVVDAVYADTSPSDKRAHYLDMLEDIQLALEPQETDFVTVSKKQDAVDSAHTRLTASQAQALIEAPNIDTLMGLRDTALIYLMLATGLREHEICALDVSDLRQTSDGHLGVYVRDGKGAKSRFVPYGDLADCLSYVDAWLAQTNITSGAVFRGFTDRHIGKAEPNSKSPSETYSRLTERLNVRSVNHILKQYPVSIDGNLKPINPHDTRRTYAKLQYENGLDILAIRDNLGHADVKTTQGYIGDMDMGKRKGKRIFSTSHDRKRLASMVDVQR